MTSNLLCRFLSFCFVLAFVVSFSDRLVQSEEENYPAKVTPENNDEREPSLMRGAWSNLVATQWSNSNKNDLTKICIKDKVIKWNGIDLKTNDDLLRNWYKAKAGEVSNLTVERNFGTASKPQLKTIQVKLTHIGGSQIFSTQNLGGRTQYRTPSEIHPEWDKISALPLKNLALTMLKEKDPAAVTNLAAAFRRTTDSVKGHYRNDEVVYLLNRPFHAEVWGRNLGDNFSNPKENGNLIVKAWSYSEPEGTSLFVTKSIVPDANSFAEWVKIAAARIAKIDEAYDKAFENLSATERTQLTAWCKTFQPRWRGGPGWNGFVAGFQLTKKANRDALRQAAVLTAQLVDDLSPGGTIFKGLLKFRNTAKTTGHGKNVIVGGAGDDTHKNTASLIIDLGGNDRYQLPAHEVEGRFRSSVIVDLSGNDTYQSNNLGIAAGALCSSMVLDISGDDSYTCDRNGLGFGLCGIGYLCDFAGQDRYHGKIFVQGTACIGVGLLVDKSGNDRYDAGSYSQAVGLPGGFGCLVDFDGEDIYTCSGHHASPYGDKDEYAGWGQGCGFGFRYLGSGGIGALVDCKGRDIYRVGQFGLGCGYFYGIGFVNDRDGDDVYECSRYGLASGAHYGVGIVLDDNGRDFYTAIRKAAVAEMGSTWDLSLGALIDSAGDDTYRGITYTMGGAAQNAYGFLWDKAGNDVYITNNGTAGEALGHASGTSYGAGRLAKNLAIFWDSAGKDTYIAKGRKNGSKGIDGEYGIWVDDSSENSPKKNAVGSR